MPQEGTIDMETMKKGKKHIGKIILVLCNVILLLVTVIFTSLYSNNVKKSQEELMLNNFCNTVETMKQISVRYLSGELEAAESWADYISNEHMTMDRAIDYISTVNNISDIEAHFIDLDTYDAWSTFYTSGTNTIGIYKEIYDMSFDSPYYTEFISRMHKIFDGEKYVLGKYKTRESQRNIISVGHKVTLRLADGTDKDYLLLRAVPISKMKELWLFPVNFPNAEIGLIGKNCDYVVPSNSMRSGNFEDFVRSYNFADNYNGTEEIVAQLETQDKGLLELNNSKNEPCYWYYSSLEEFNGLDVVGYIPVADLSSGSESMSIVFAVAGMLMLIILIDGAYVLNINRQLRITAKIAENASNAKTQFLSSMSHDIRTPLNAVLGMTELAQRHMNDMNYVQDCLRKINISGNHLLTLINDILEISRVESGKTSINPEPFNVRELVSGLESIINSQTVGRGESFDIQIDELPEPWLIGDKLRLTQVYLNLLNNAVKYTNPGGSIRLEVREEKTDSEGIILVCVIADTGIGMSPEFQKNMYDSFTRVNDSRIDKIQGTGLGLAIVKRMIDLMDGRIDCISAEGKGTTFTVRIPLKAVPQSKEITQSHTEGGHDNGIDLADLNLLIAEDNDINWEIISEMLTGYGIHCNRAENGRECVDIVTSQPPNTYDLILMDVQMPILNGRDAAREIRANKRADLQTIPIVAMTADAFAEDVQMCIDAGMDGHLSKPIEIDKVLATIRQMLYRKNSSEKQF